MWMVLKCSGRRLHVRFFARFSPLCRRSEIGFFGRSDGRSYKKPERPVTLTSGRARTRPLGVDTFALGDDHVIK